MFILTTIEDVIAIEPRDFTKPSAKALEDNVNEKYANKITQEVGLYICFYDLLEASDGLIGHGEGRVHVKATFRMIVFRPFKGEILEGRILKMTPKGIHLTMDFFSDIFVPAPSCLFDNCHFRTEKDGAIWVWVNDGAELYFDKNERVRFRVEEEIWTDLAPGDEPPRLTALPTNTSAPGAKTAAPAIEAVSPPGDRHQVVEGDLGRAERMVGRAKMSDEQKKSLRAWRITGSMCAEGLGVTNWW